MPISTYPLDDPFDLVRTLRPLGRGTGDATMRFGPATLALSTDGAHLTAEAWGPGADRALEGVPELVGLTAGPMRVASHSGVVDLLARRFPGVRLTLYMASLIVFIAGLIVARSMGAGRKAAVGADRV